MRKVLLPLIALSACMTWASSASAGTWYTKVINQTVYVGSAPNSFQIGTLFTGDYFTYNTDDTSGGQGYRWGHAFGSANKCGWVAVLALSGTTTTISSACNAALYKSEDVNLGSRQYLRTYYACAVNDYVPSGTGAPNPFWWGGLDTGSYAAVNYPVNAYANYVYGSATLTGPVTGTVWTAGGQFNWRWISDGSKVVLGKVPSPGGWGFIGRGALPSVLAYQDGIGRYDWQAGG